MSLFHNLGNKFDQEMKLFTILIFSTILTSTFFDCFAQNPLVFLSEKVEKKWEAHGNLRTPECVLFDNGSSSFFVSNINGSPRVKDGDGFISKLDKKGTIINLQWIRGLNAPKGMSIYKELLYVTDIDQLIIIDHKKGQILKKIDIPEAKFLNDICIDDNGKLFISDSQQRVIYTYENDLVEKWFEGEILSFPNGLCIKDKHLYIGNYTYILKVNIKDKTYSKMVENIGGGVDGMKFINDQELIISDWTGNVHHINKEHKLTKLIGTADVGINAADFEFISKYNLLLIPTFGYNTVAAYKIKQAL